MRIKYFFIIFTLIAQSSCTKEDNAKKAIGKNVYVEIVNSSRSEVIIIHTNQDCPQLGNYIVMPAKDIRDRYVGVPTVCPKCVKNEDAEKLTCLY